MRIINTEEERLMAKVCDIMREVFDRFIWDDSEEEGLRDDEPRLPKGYKEWPSELNLNQKK